MHKTLHQFRGHAKSIFVKGRGEGVIKKWTKTNREGGGGVLAFVYVRPFKKSAVIFKMKFYSYPPDFPIYYKGSMKY